MKPVNEDKEQTFTTLIDLLESKAKDFEERGLENSARLYREKAQRIKQGLPLIDPKGKIDINTNRHKFYEHDKDKKNFNY